MLKYWLIVFSFFGASAQAEEFQARAFQTKEFQTQEFSSLYRIHCEVHTIVSVYYDGVFSSQDEQFVSDFMVTIIDHPIWIKKEDINFSFHQNDNGVVLNFEHTHTANDGRFVKINISNGQSLISQDFGSVFFDDRQAICNIKEETPHR